MKIAILGTRGIPARYGGFETLADQLSKRLVDRGLITSDRGVLRARDFLFAAGV